jgi:hypothetical protein
MRRTSCTQWYCFLSSRPSVPMPIGCARGTSPQPPSPATSPDRQLITSSTARTWTEKASTRLASHNVWLAQLAQHVHTLDLDHWQASPHDHVI